MKIGDVVYHKVHGLMEVKRNKYQRLGNKNVFFGTDESGKEHEIDDSVESPEKYLKEKEKKESPKMMESMAELLSSIQGPQGEKGLDSDEESIIEKVLERIELPKDGKDGADADIELVARELLPKVIEKMPKPEKVNESSIVEKLMMRIKIPQDGKQGEKGKDGSPDTPKEIKGKLETLTGDERLDASAIKNLPKPIIGGGQSYTGLVKVDSTGTPGTLEDKLVAGSNITLTKTNDTIRIASSGGVGGGSVDSVVAGNNIDVDATDPANPVVSVETLTLADISDVTASVTEINYVDGVTSPIQTQLNGKASSLGVDDNYVTDAQLVVIGNTSGTNTGDNATNTQYSGLAASKQDTLVSGTNIKTINSTSLLGSGDIAVSAAPGGSDTQVQFNDGGALGGDAGLTYDKLTDTLGVSTIQSPTYVSIGSAGVSSGDGEYVSIFSGSTSDSVDASGGSIEIIAGQNLNFADIVGGGLINVSGGYADSVAPIAFGGEIEIRSGTYGGVTNYSSFVSVGGYSTVDGINIDGGSVSIISGSGDGSGIPGKIYAIGDFAVQNSGSNINAILDTASLSSTDKTFTFPNATGTLALTSDIHQATSKTTPVDADEIGLIDSAASWVLKKITILGLKLAIYAGIKPAEGTVWNGKISVTDTGSGINVALKTLSGADASSSDPIYITIAGAVRTITGALSVTKADGTNWCNAGSAELATKEIDYFVYLGYNSTDGVVIGFSRIPGANSYDDFSTTTTNEKYCAISTITNAAATDYYEVIGRFAATLSAGAGYTWSVPTYTAKNLIQRPIYETRWLTWLPTFTGFSAAPATPTARYQLKNTLSLIRLNCGNNGTSNATGFTFTIPISSGSAASSVFGTGQGVDNSVNPTIPSILVIGASDSVVDVFKDWSGAAWTGSGAKGLKGAVIDYEI